MLENVLFQSQESDRLVFRQDIIGEGRAEYGKQIVSTLSRQLTAEYGRGFSRPSVFRMIRFAEVFPESGIVQTPSALATQN